jgi:uncharacterized protein
MRVFDFGQNTGVYMFLTPAAGIGGTPPRFAITTGGSGQEQQLTAGSPLPAGEWVHLAVTLSGTTGTLYVKGQVAATNTGMTLNPASLGSPANLWIGKSEFSDPFLNGTADEFQIFSRALSQAEVSSLLSSAAGTTGGGDVAWYRFDETGGATAVDSSRGGRDATIIPVPNPAAWVPTFPGYLGANPDDLVLRLGPPRFATYGGDNGTWVPLYVQHKLMRGLLDCYEIADSQQALQVVETMADWANLVLTIGDKNHPDYPGPLTQANSSTTGSRCSAPASPTQTSWTSPPRPIQVRGARTGCTPISTSRRTSATCASTSRPGERLLPGGEELLQHGDPASHVRDRRHRRRLPGLQ